MLYRKIISGVLAALTTLMCCANSALATGSYTADTDTFAVKVAQGLGAIESYEPEKKVTVADFKKTVDALAVNSGYSSIYFEKSKSDEQEIKCKDAAAVVCDMLGYGVFCNAGRGGIKPDEMMPIASKYGILKGVSEDKDETLTMQSLVNMIYNVLEAKTLDTEYLSGGGFNTTLTGKRYLEDVMGMTFINGVVEATKFSSLKFEDGTETNQIQISGVLYNCNIDDYEEYIGMKVKALVNYNDGDEEVLALYDNGESFAVDADDLEYGQISKTAITYYNQNGRKMTLSISDTADVLYNFSLLKDWNEEDLKVRQGRLVCIDNNGDGKYDVIKIEEYKSMLIFSASIDSKKISNSSGVAVSIKKLIENGYHIYDGEKIIKPENIPTGAVATYFLDKTGEVMKMYVHSDVSAGVVRSIDKENNKITLDDKVYSYTDELESDIENVSVGTSVTVNINVYGEIAAYQIAKDSYLYGYMINFWDDDGSGNVKVKIFTQGNEIKVYETSNKVNLNGSSMSAQKAFQYNLSTGLWDEVGRISQIVKYKVNSKDELTSIRTATNYFDASHPERLLKEKDGVYKYYPSSKTIAGDTRLNVLTKVFLIPTDLNEITKFKYGGMEIMGTRENFTCQIYDIDEDRYAGVLVSRINPYGKAQIDDIAATPYLIESVSETLNAREELSVSVTAHQVGVANAPIKELVFNSPDISLTYCGKQILSGDLKKGDIIMVSKDYTMSGEYGNFIMWCRPDLTTPYEATKAYWNQEASERTFYADRRILAYGEVIKVVKDGLLINNKPKSTENYDAWNRIINVSGTTPVYICDKEEKGVVKASIADVQPGDKVFSLLSSSITPSELVIYRNFE